jgi:hypothetical protein
VNSAIRCVSEKPEDDKQGMVSEAPARSRWGHILEGLLQGLLVALLP